MDTLLQFVLVMLAIWLIVACRIAYLLGRAFDDEFFLDEDLGALVVTAVFWPMVLCFAAGRRVEEWFRKRKEKS